MSTPHRRTRKALRCKLRGVMRNSVEKSGMDCVADFAIVLIAACAIRGAYRVFWCISPASPHLRCGSVAGAQRSGGNHQRALACNQLQTKTHSCHTGRAGVQGACRGGLLHIQRSFFNPPYRGIEAMQFQALCAGGLPSPWQPVFCPPWQNRSSGLVQRYPDHGHPFAKQCPGQRHPRRGVRVAGHVQQPHR